MADCDVIVIGLGAMGSAAAYALAQSGRQVLGIEQFTPAHELGSSHGGSRIVRKAYFEDPAYVPLLRRSYQLWDKLSAEYGEPLFSRCGALMIGAPDSVVVSGTLRAAARWSLAHEVLTAPELTRRYPQFRPPPDHLAVLETDAGFLRPEVAVLANLTLAQSLGAELWFDTEVDAVELGPQGVHVSAAGDEVTAPRAVLATGAWAPRLARMADFGIRVSRETMHWFQPSAEPHRYDPTVMPVFVWDRPVPSAGRDTTVYGFPRLPGEQGVKTGFYHDGTDLDADPDALDRAVSAAHAQDLSDVLDTVMPGLAGDWLGGRACMYAGVPDDHFLLGLHPGSSGRVVLAVGMSGHGFKFAPVVGEIVTELVADGQSQLDVRFLDPARIRRGT
jgi:sarcosine oxidase